MPAKRATLSLALNAPAGKVPEWIEVLPPGPEIKGRDGRHWRMTDASKVIARSLTPDNGTLFVDYEHGSEIRAPKGEAAPAAGWITALEERAGSVWARVEWTPRAAEMVSNREYRFISPTFFFDTDTLEVRALVSAALTNAPNLNLTALNRAQDTDANPPENDTMDKEQLKALCKKLGLKDEASGDAILAAVDALAEDKAKALNAASAPSLEKFVPRADFDKVKGERDDSVKALNALKAEGSEAAVVTAVDEAVKAGKVAPASKDFYLATCRKEGGLEEFKKFVETAPSITAASGLDGKAITGDGALTADEKAVCRAMNLSEDDFKKAKAA